MSSRKQWRFCALIVGALAQASLADSPPTYKITPVGLPAAPGQFEFNSVNDVNAASQASGIGYRYAADESTSLGFDVWFYDGSATRQIGLTGLNYNYVISGANGGIYQNSTWTQSNGVGQVIGTSARYNSQGTGLGNDAWLFDGLATHQIGFTGVNYSYASPGAGGGTVQYSSPVQINSAGQVIGASNRYNPVGTLLGQDGWLYGGSGTQQIGLIGANYSYLYTGQGGGTAQSTTPMQINNAGQAVGTSTRYNTVGTTLGFDSWFFNGTTTTQIGLTGAGYNYASPGAGGGTVENSAPFQISPAGQVSGTSNRYNSSGTLLGQDAWMYSGGSTQQIGLTGGSYSYAYTGSGGGAVQSTTLTQMNPAGQVIGTSNRYNASGTTLGQDAWIYNGSSTHLVGLTGANYGYAASGGIYQSSALNQLNSSGKVIGTSLRYNASGGSLGQDAWLYNGTSTAAIGLAGPNYSYQAGGGTIQESSPFKVNAAGQVAGVSNRNNSLGIGLGQDSWIYDGTTTKQIGLTGTNYSYDYGGAGGGTNRYSFPSFINDAGQVVGISGRFTNSAANNGLGAPNGQAGWFFDSTTNATTPLEFSVRSFDQYSFTDPEFLTNSGVVLGQYELYNGNIDEGSCDFYWSLSSGFHDLGSLVLGGNWTELLQGINAFAGAPDAIATLSDNDPYILTAVTPEPGSIAVSAIAFLGLLLRRPATGRRA